MFIYKITNTVNGKLYIGKTKFTIERRWISGHKSRLNTNKHYNKHLQSAWNKYGDSPSLKLFNHSTH